MEAQSILVLQLWPARVKAKQAGVLEATGLLADLGAAARVGGPLADRSGVVWVDIPTAAVPEATARFPLLGYTASVRLLVPAAEARAGDERVHWQGRPHALHLLHEADTGLLESRAPHRRSFLLECGDGVVRKVPGYRGGRDPLSHRALPVQDARLLVNLVHRPGRAAFLDPFAGAGSIVLEAREHGWFAVSADIDPALRYGLASLGSGHVVADARALPFSAGSFDAIATEPPYHPSATATVVEALTELYRLLRPGGVLSMLVARDQRPDLVRQAGALGFTIELDVAVDRKGLPVAALAWTR
ncbi:MAG TPA: methyltransferase domain-containing protein [Candidatus Dormibacteraeota bacterium]|nr:methyltransferase domain-containing protein [Candidatus Dormibacteraeota bacterium]